MKQNEKKTNTKKAPRQDAVVIPGPAPELPVAPQFKAGKDLTLIAQFGDDIKVTAEFKPPRNAGDPPAEES